MLSLPVPYAKQSAMRVWWFRIIIINYFIFLCSKCIYVSIILFYFFVPYWAGVPTRKANNLHIGPVCLPYMQNIFLHIGQGKGLKWKNIFCILGRCACPICKILHIGPICLPNMQNFCVLGFFAYWASTGVFIWKHRRMFCSPII